MGLGPPIIALYRQMADLGLFENVERVMELGSQNVWCPKEVLVKELFSALDRAEPTPEMLEDFKNWRGVARNLYEELGFSYDCIDTDGKYGALTLDINFDDVPDTHKQSYDFVTNHGTTEHLLNQANGFKVVHDFTKPRGYMLHALPFWGQWNHGFFNYQPELFEALARYNGYKMLGMWVGIDWQLSSLVPWEAHLLDFLTLNSKSTGLLVVLFQKQHANDFQIPFQGIYETTKTDEVSDRYQIIIDGSGVDESAERKIADTPTKELARILMYRIQRKLGLKS